MLPRLLASLVVLALVVGGRVAAHEIRPAIVTAMFGAAVYDVAVVVNMEALIAGVSPVHADTGESPSAADYDRLRALPVDDLTARIRAFAPTWLEGVTIAFDGTRATPRIVGVEVADPGDLGLARLTTVRLAGGIPAGARTFTWRYAAPFGSSVLRVRRAGDDEMVTSWLKDGSPSAAVPLAGAAGRSTIATAVDYVVLGFTHILPKGLDHILFVLGLYLLGTSLRPLLVQVTAFTIAHSITLALGVYGVIEVRASIVEPLIAASIVYVAVENLVTAKLHPWRPVVVFGFGLLHGVGFAGVLHEIGLPRADYVIGLVAFNVGVELGQLSAIGLAFAATGLWFGARPWYRARIVWPASAAIAVVGLVWTVQRVFAG